MSDFDRPGKARALLNDPFYQEVCKSVEQAIIDAWANTPTHKKEQAHELRLMLAAARNYRKSIEATAREGKTELHRSKQPTFLGDLISWNRNKRAN